MERLWQSLILAQWNPQFANLPIESLIHQHQADYYQALAQNTKQSDCALFVEFILDIIAATLTEQINTPQDVIEIMQKQPGLVDFCKIPRSRTELQAFFGLKDREHFRKTILKPLIDAGILLLSIPDKPSSPKQRYGINKDVV